jgi:hypothetical protein
MKNFKKNIYWLVAGITNLFTALLHTIGGQLDLVNPLTESNLTTFQKGQWFGGWHIVTITLFFTSYLLLKNALRPAENEKRTMKYIGTLYLLYSIPFIISSFMNQLLIPQWILLLPIGVLTIIGNKLYANFNPNLTSHHA